MKIKFIQPYISISKFKEIEINDFSILTGKNGSGKTHFLNGIKNGSIEIEGVNKSEIVYYNYNDFTIFTGNIQQNFNFQNRINVWNDEKDQFYNKIQVFKNKAITINPISKSELGEAMYNLLQQSNFNFGEYFNNEKDFKLLENCIEGSNTLNLLKSNRELFTPQFYNFTIMYYSHRQGDISDLKYKKITKDFIEIQDFMIVEIINRFVMQETFKFTRYFGNKGDFELLKSLKNEKNIRTAINLNQNFFTIRFYDFVKLYPFISQVDIDDFTYENLEMKFKMVQESLEKKLFDDNEALYKFLKCKVTDKSILHINSNDFESPNLFLEDIANEEKEYQFKKIQNSLNKIQAEEYNQEVTYLNAEKFIVQNGLSPVEQINKVLLEYDCNGYSLSTNQSQRFLGIDKSNIKIDISLKHNDKGYSTTFDQLSSGEKTLIALSLFIYKTRKNRITPRVMLLDEIDSSLHPSMINRLLNVIENLFIKEQGFKVIMATHSPTTVALSPEDSVYIIEQNGEQIIKKQLKSYAIGILTEGIATINNEDTYTGINYNLTHTELPIVFTEGITDKIILEIAWSKIYNSKMPFFIQDCFDASFLGNLFRRAEDGQDGIFSNYPDKTFVSLFDFDEAGYNVWKGLKKNYSIFEENPRKGLTIKHKTKKAYSVLLPVPKNEIINKQVIKSGNETYKNESVLTIELLFYGIKSLDSFFIKEQTKGGGEIIVFKGMKRDFAKSLKNLTRSDFKNLIPLFDKINEIINS